MKRIILVALAVLVLCCMFSSCDDGTRVVLPGSEQTDINSPNTDETAKTQPSFDTPVIDIYDEPTPTPTEVYDPFTYWGGFDSILQSASVYGNGFEIWPFMGNNEYCPRAFWLLSVVLNKDEADFTENFENPLEHTYEWKLWFKNSEFGDPAVITNWTGPYTISPVKLFDFSNGSVLYRFNIADCPEGYICEQMELGSSYDVIISVTDTTTGNSFGFLIITVTWNTRSDADFKIYNYFWKYRARENGIFAGDQTLTDDDIAYQESHGYKIIDGNMNFEYIG